MIEERYIRVNSKIISLMVEGRPIFLMANITKENLTKVLDMELAYFFMLTKMIQINVKKANGKMIDSILE